MIKARYITSSLHNYALAKNPETLFAQTCKTCQLGYFDNVGVKYRRLLDGSYYALCTGKYNMKELFEIVFNSPREHIGPLDVMEYLVGGLKIRQAGRINHTLGLDYSLVFGQRSNFFI